jgi:hypothetical protein
MAAELSGHLYFAMPVDAKQWHLIDREHLATRLWPDERTRRRRRNCQATKLFRLFACSGHVVLRFRHRPRQITYTLYSWMHSARNEMARTSPTRDQRVSGMGKFLAQPHKP